MAVAQHNAQRTVLFIFPALWWGGQRGEGGRSSAWWGVSRDGRKQWVGTDKGKGHPGIEKEFLKVNEGSCYGAWKRQGGMESWQGVVRMRGAPKNFQRTWHSWKAASREKGVGSPGSFCDWVMDLLAEVANIRPSPVDFAVSFWVAGRQSSPFFWVRLINLGFFSGKELGDECDKWPWCPGRCCCRLPLL